MEGFSGRDNSTGSKVQSRLSPPRGTVLCLQQIIPSGRRGPNRYQARTRTGQQQGLPELPVAPSGMYYRKENIEIKLKFKHEAMTNLLKMNYQVYNQVQSIQLK